MRSERKTMKTTKEDTEDSIGSTVLLGHAEPPAGLYSVQSESVQCTVMSETVTIYHGDCRDIMATIEADAIITDPPYGIAYDGSHKKYKNGKDHGECEWDKCPYDPAPILQKNLPSVIWGGNCFASRLPDNPGWLCWVKINQNGTKIRQAEMELAWTNCVNRSQSYRFNWIGAGMEGETNAVYGGTIHPTQKPVPLMGWCMETAGIKEGETVLDPYMGSGSTGIAAIRTGRKFIGIEKDPEHFKNAKERIERELSQRDLFLA